MRIKYHNGTVPPEKPADFGLNFVNNIIWNDFKQAFEVHDIPVRVACEPKIRSFTEMAEIMKGRLHDTMVRPFSSPRQDKHRILLQRPQNMVRPGRTRTSPVAINLRWFELLSNKVQ